jgi:hypothetical protein
VLFGPQTHQDFLITRGDEQTGRRRSHRKCISVIDCPRVIYYKQSRLAFERFAQSVLGFLLCDQRLLRTRQLAQELVLQVKQVRLLADS